MAIEFFEQYLGFCISEKLGIDFDGLHSETILNQTWWELNQVSGLGRCPVYGGRRAKKRFCFSK